MFLAGWLAVYACGRADAEPASSVVSQQGPWCVVESANFRVCGITSREQIKGLLDTCEATRGKLSAQWLGGGKTAAWEPKCYIVLHPTANSYLREVGEGQMTAGSSLIEFAANRLVTRRVDLRADHPDGYLGGLAHELTHVVVADRFIERQIPRWADEGMAVLADTQGKQALHHADLSQARANRTAFRLVELMQLENYPDASHAGGVLRSERIAGAISGCAWRRASFCRLSDEVWTKWATTPRCEKFTNFKHGRIGAALEPALGNRGSAPRVHATPAVVSQASIPAAQSVSVCRQPVKRSALANRYWQKRMFLAVSLVREIQQQKKILAVGPGSSFRLTIDLHLSNSVLRVVGLELVVAELDF